LKSERFLLADAENCVKIGEEFIKLITIVYWNWSTGVATVRRE